MFLAYGALAYLPLQIDDRESLWINNSLIEKESISDAIKRPKIVFLGGSATLFGVRTKEIQKEFNLPTVNLAVHAGLKIDYILYRAKRSLKEGDTVILIPEYAHYIYDGGLTEIKINYVRNYDREYFDSRPLAEKFNYLYSTSFNGFLKSIKNHLLLDSAQDQEVEIGKGYNSTTLNENGDETYNIRTADKDEKLLKLKPLELNKAVFAETLGLRAIKDFSGWCQLNNIRLYIAYPPTIYFKEYDSEEYRDYFNRSLGYFADNGIMTIGAPYDSFYDISMFYDSVYHLNSEGMSLNTWRLIDALKKLEIFSGERPH